MLQVENLSLKYGDAVAFENISLTLSQGALVAIVGGNGAGKTSLIRTLSGIYTPWQGRVWFKGKDVTGLDSHYLINAGIGHIAEGRQIFPSLTVKENLEVGGMIPRTRKNLVRNLSRVYALFPKLQQRLDQRAGTLSGGEQQMLAIGRCLMGEPELILFDEPSIGLSPLMVKEMFKIIKLLHQEGLSILLVEQNLKVSLDIADFAYVLENGRIVLKGSGRDLLNSDLVRKAYLGI